MAKNGIDDERNPMLDMVEHTISMLHTLDPDLDIRLEQQEAYCRIHLPLAPLAEYRIVLYVYDDGEPQICTEPDDVDPDTSFWSWHFEQPDYESQSEREEVFLTAVYKLLTSPTRIRQKQGIFFNQFQCEILKAPCWSRVGQVNHHCRCDKIPSTYKKVVYYTSPALIDP